jgi:hypothetical protein
LDDASPLLLFLLIDLFEEASERAAVWPEPEAWDSGGRISWRGMSH